MKIGILIDELAPGSAPKLIGQSVKGLNKLGHSCEALVLVDNKKQKQFSAVYNYHLGDVEIKYLFNQVPSWVRKIDFRFPGFSFFSLHHILSFFIAPAIIHRNEYDIIIAYCQYSAFAGWSLKAFKKIPYLLLVWDPSTYTLRKIYTKTWLRLFYPILYVCAWILDKFSTKGSKALITSGRLHHQRFKKISGKPLEDLYPGCFPQKEFTPFTQRQKTILAYDRWDVGNKPHLFLTLLEKIDADIKLKIGGFWYPQDIRIDFIQAIKTRNLEERIELLGPLDEQRILQLCSQAMVHIHPNEEAFGMQTLEAAACGCPIIIPQGSGVTDLFQHEVHGYFPQKGNMNEIIRYTQLVFADLRKTEAMAKKAWEIARKYNWDNYVQRLEEIIKIYA